MGLYGERIIALGLDETGITDGAGRAIGQLTNLESLSLRHSDVSDSILENLVALRGLAYLDLGDTNISGHGGRYSGDSLVCVHSFSGTRVTDDVVAHLTQLPNLTF